MRGIQPALVVDLRELAHANFVSSFFCQFSQDCHMCVAIGAFFIELALTLYKTKFIKGNCHLENKLHLFEIAFDRK